MAEHARRIQEADLRFPVILAPDGSLMDGGHRIAQAWLAGKQTVGAVTFDVEPAPDWVTDDEEALASTDGATPET